MTNDNSKKLVARLTEDDEDDLLFPADVMPQPKNIGTDYSGGRSNMDRETGIHYGLISQNNVGQAWYDEAQPEYGPLTCPSCGNEVRTADEDNADEETGEYWCSHCMHPLEEDDFAEQEAQYYAYMDTQYTLSSAMETEILVAKAPYYTFAQFCSPCAPGAGNLDRPMSNGAKTYCLGHEWFEDRRAPYRVYRVDNNDEVTANG